MGQEIVFLHFTQVFGDELESYGLLMCLILKKTLDFIVFSCKLEIVCAGTLTFTTLFNEHPIILHFSVTLGFTLFFQNLSAMQV